MVVGEERDASTSVPQGALCMASPVVLGVLVTGGEADPNDSWHCIRSSGCGASISESLPRETPKKPSSVLSTALIEYSNINQLL